MTNASNPSTNEELFAMLRQGSGAGSPTLSTLASAVMAAYDAYPYGQPSLDGYNVVQIIWVWEITSASSVVFGFTAAANDGTHNLLALRGTYNTDEGFWDVTGWGDPVPFYLTDEFGNTQQYGSAESSLAGFYQDGGLYTSLADSLKAAVQQLDSSLPLFVTAHSLGGAMATLGALDVVVSGVYPNAPTSPCVVTFGSLHVGDVVFAQIYNSRLPLTLRIANLCDFVPSFVGIAPPSQNPPPPTPYVHVGLPFVFVWEKWDGWANHSMQYTYQVVVDQYLDVLTYGTPTDTPYPAPWGKTGVPGRAGFVSV